MPKIEKTFPSPYGGISEQSTELMLDTQCVDMVNCIPDVVLGTQRRNGTKFVGKNELGLGDKVFHFYDRGEGEEVYFMCLEDSTTNPIRVFKPNGEEQTVSYQDASLVHSYLSNSPLALRAITVQDRTFIVNTKKQVGITIVDTPDILYDRPAYYWLSRSSNDVNNKYNYAVYLDGVTYQYASEKSDTAATALAGLITAGGSGLSATAIGSLIKISKTGYGTTGVGGGLRVPYDASHKYVAIRPTATGTTEYVDVTLCDTTVTPVEQTLCYKMTVQNYYIENVIGGTTTWKTFAELEPLGSSINFKYYSKLGSNYVDPQVRTLDVIVNSNGAFTFSYWDSWGSQASFGWQGKVQKLSDLPSEVGFSNVIVNVTGNDSNSFTDYYLKYDGSTWVETRNPQDNRGTFTNMPIYIDRLSDGTFNVGFIDWESSHVGDLTTNPTPSFVNNYINDIVFYKNRLGFSSSSAVTLSETGGYYNFYPKTVLEVLDDDPIDLSIPSGEATFIYYLIPYQKYLFMFTQYAQYALTDKGTSFSPNTVSIDLISSIPIDVNVRPIRANSSLYFLSKIGSNKRQLREYKYYDDTLIADGINLSVQTPNLLPSIKSMTMDSSLGYIVLVPEEDRRTLYIYKFLEQGKDKVQSAFFKFTFNFDINEYVKINDNTLFVITQNNDNSILLGIDLSQNNDTKVDIIDDIGTLKTYISYFTLPKWNIKTVSLETSNDLVVVKRLKINGVGKFNVGVYRKDYNTTYYKTYDSNSTVEQSASILGKNKYVDITISSYENEQFRVDSMILQGMYTQTNKETN